MQHHMSMPVACRSSDTIQSSSAHVKIKSTEQILHQQNPTPPKEEPALSLKTREHSAGSPTVSQGISAYVGPGSTIETPNIGSF